MHVDEIVLLAHEQLHGLPAVNDQLLQLLLAG